jgi:type IV secretion system protein VirB10
MTHDTERAAVEPPEPSRNASSPAFERAISPISGRLGTGRGGRMVAFAALVGGCGVFLAATWGGDDKPKAARMPDQPARQVVPFEPIRPKSAPTLAEPGPDAPSLVANSGPQVPALQPTANGGTTAAHPSDRRRAELAAIRGAPMLAYSRSGGAPGAVEVARPAVSAERVSTPTELDELRQGSALGRARATRLGDRNFLLLAGAAIPCVLQTAMDTAAPGYVSCLVSRDVLSDNGAVVLMEKGTRVLGEYRSGMRQGQKRLFVLWTRAVTPGGVAIARASPAADPLGRAGFDGDLDTHFWERFGGALLLSIVDGGASALASRGETAGVVRLPSDAAGIALQNSINIPPSLRKAQGSEVSIFVAQDFDFSGVYGLRSR